ncbi:MAG TPA: tripartite tricarboxylate transporter TctB family protein [Negativicutes bacterium]|nr:tripartite tricarboxylate transporter TctB family protein [Negativicutes bacterium]
MHSKGRDTLKNAGVWAGIITFCIGGLFLWGATGLRYASPVGPGPGLFPVWLSVILIILSFLYIWESKVKEIILLSDVLPKGKELKSLLGIVVAPVVFMIVVPFTGFCIAGTVLMLMLLLRAYKWHTALAISVVTSVLTFLLFQSFLDVPLPVNAFGW